MPVNQGDKITFQWLQTNILTPLEQQWKKRDYNDPNYNCTQYSIPNDFRNVITQGKIISIDDINQIKTNMDYLYDNFCRTYYSGHKYNQYSSQYTSNRSDHHVTYYYSQDFTINSLHLYNHNNTVQTGYNNSYKSGVDSSHYLTQYAIAYVPHNSTYETSVNINNHVTYQNDVNTGNRSSHHGWYFYAHNQTFDRSYCSSNYSSVKSAVDRVVINSSTCTKECVNEHGTFYQNVTQ